MTCIVKLENGKTNIYHSIIACFIKGVYIYLQESNKKSKVLINDIKDFALYDYD